MLCESRNTDVPYVNMLKSSKADLVVASLEVKSELANVQPTSESIKKAEAHNVSNSNPDNVQSFLSSEEYVCDDELLYFHPVSLPDCVFESDEDDDEDAISNPVLCLVFAPLLPRKLQGSMQELCGRVGG